MASKDSILRYRIIAENDQLKRDLAKAKGRLNRFKNQSNAISRQIKGSLAAAFSVGAIVGFGRALARTTEDYDKQAKAIAQVEQAIISTGGAANKSLFELQKTAENLQKNTLFGDEEILVGATAQLLTFTNIANENFDRVQKSVLDVSTRLGQDLKSTAIQLGKALNDPVANLGALGRSGIQFSKEQKAVIKSLSETNRLAEAQAMILEELENQYGGSAEAAAQAGTGGWTQLSNSFGDLREQIGELIAENSASRGLSKWLNDITESIYSTTRALNSNLSGWDKFKMVVSKGLGNVMPSLGAYGDAISAAGNAIKDSEEKTRSDEAAQKAAIVQRERQVQAIRQQIAALKELTNTQELSNISTLGLESPQLANTSNEINLSPVSSTLSLDKFSKELQAKYQMIINLNTEMGLLMRDTAASALSQFAEGLGTSGISGAFDNLVKVFADGISRIGDSLIAYGVAMVAAQLGLKNPFANVGGVGAIAAGIAAKVAAGALKSAISNSTSRMSGGGGGSGRSGPSGSFQNNIEGQSIRIDGGKFRIEGKDLVYILNEQDRAFGRTRG